MIRKILKYLMISLAALLGVILMYGLIQYPKAKKEQHFIVERAVKASPETIWSIISDIGNYHLVTAPGIDQVKIISGKGLGLKRECVAPSGISWEETCTEWIPNERFSFKVNTEREDYPFPLKSLNGSWVIEKINTEESKIILDFSYTFSNPFLAGYFLKAGTKQAREDSNYLLDNWQKMIEEGVDYEAIKLSNK